GGSIETEDVLTNYFDAVGQPWVDTQFSGRSDYQAFIVNGVPASGLFTGAEGLKTPAQEALFGGTAEVAYDSNYHSSGDDIDNVNVEALDINSDAIAHAALTLAQSTATINGARSAGTSGNPHPVDDHLHEPAA
ncbi:MAG TPA: M28 family peptidase, partial [Pedococcus sp.]|nr:M28 family peptidase [Pedococcus sp.]